MLEVTHLSAFVSRRFRIEDVSVSVVRGERLAVLGENGSGKSTLLRLLAGLHTPSGGSIAWEREPWSRDARLLVPPERRPIGMVHQQGALFPHLGVRANVALGLPPGTRTAARREAVERALGLARVSQADASRVDRLSGGERQRIALARALVRKPALLLLDEPLHSLDAAVGRRIVDELRLLVERERAAAVLVTHDIHEAAAFADRVLLLRDGRAVQTGTFRELYETPVDLAAAELLGPVERVASERARAAGLQLPDRCTGPYVVFRPEHLELRKADGSDPEGLRVVETRFSAGHSAVTIALPDGATLRSHRAAGGAPGGGADGQGLGPGDRVVGRITRHISLDSSSS